MKLDINKSYIVFTTSEYIVNKQVRILGYINYDRASQYRSYIENVAINEKFIENTNIVKDEDGVDQTLEYLKKQIYYDCCVLKYENSEYKLTDEHIILWDDIIDTERTERLFENYNYNLSFKFKDIDPSDTLTKDKVIKVITNAINEAFNKYNEKVELQISEKDVTDTNIESQLTSTKNLLVKSNEALQNFINLQKSAKKINDDFSSNNILEKINILSDNVESIKDSTNTIIANLK